MTPEVSDHIPTPGWGRGCWLAVCCPDAQGSGTKEPQPALLRAPVGLLVTGLEALP